MSTFFKKILCRITLFFALAVTQNAQATPNFDILRGFEQITQIPDHANPYAGMALLHMMPTYLNALDEDQTPATKNLLLHLFKCPHPELDPSHILPVTGEFQVAHHLKPLLIGEIIATIDFAQKDIPESISVEDTQQKIITLKAILLHKLNTHLPNTSEFHKKNRHFVDLLIESLKECGSFSLDAQNAQLIPHFASGALLAFLCLMASDKESLQEYCIAYQVEKNRLVGTELEIQYPIEEIATTKKRNVLMSWKAAKTINSQSIFIDSLITFLKSTYNEMAQIIEIPDIKTRGTRYPVCIETLLCNLVQFTLKSSTFKNKELSIINFFKESQTQNLEQHITDFSQLINNLPGFVYGKIITSDDNVVSRHTKKFDLASEIDGFIHIGDNLSESKLTNFFKNREDFKIIKEQDGIVFIHLGNKILGVYNPANTYGLAIRANLNNIISGLVHLLEINFEVDNAQLMCNATYAKEIFDSLAPLIDWKLKTLANFDNCETLSISASNNTGGLIINLSAVHGFCSCPTERERLRGRANGYSLSLFKLHCSTQETQHAYKSLILLTALAPWNLAKLITMKAAPKNPYGGLPGVEPVTQMISEIPEGLARHLYLGQEINDESCAISIIDILQNDRGYRFIDVINFLHKNIKAALSIKTKQLLNNALCESTWINENQELGEKLNALVV
jgi:hypothetical protein